MLHSFVGYSDAPTPLQLLIYVGYLAIVIIVYLGARTRAETRRERAGLSVGGYAAAGSSSGPGDV